MSFPILTVTIKIQLQLQIVNKYKFGTIEESILLLEVLGALFNLDLIDQTRKEKFKNQYSHLMHDTYFSTSK